MLRICSFAGETVATFNADEVEGKTVKLLKIAVAKQIGVTRFRQRWHKEDHTELKGEAVVPCCDVQLVVLPFQASPGAQHGQESAAHFCMPGNQVNEVADLLRKCLHPAFYGEALDVAANSVHSEVMRLLLEAGADKAAADFCSDYGMTALHVAAQRGHTEVVKVFLEACADKDSADCDGTTVLRVAAIADKDVKPRTSKRRKLTHTCMMDTRIHVANRKLRSVMHGKGKARGQEQVFFEHS